MDIKEMLESAIDSVVQGESVASCIDKILEGGFGGHGPAVLPEVEPEKRTTEDPTERPDKRYKPSKNDPWTVPDPGVKPSPKQRRGLRV